MFTFLELFTNKYSLHVGTANSRLTCKYQYTSIVKRYIQHRTVGKIEDVFNDIKKIMDAYIRGNLCSIAGNFSRSSLANNNIFTSSG
jgi:hypothetical protein